MAKAGTGWDQLTFNQVVVGSIPTGLTTTRGSIPGMAAMGTRGRWRAECGPAAEHAVEVARRILPPKPCRLRQAICRTTSGVFIPAVMYRTVAGKRQAQGAAAGIVARRGRRQGTSESLRAGTACVGFERLPWV